MDRHAPLGTARRGPRVPLLATAALALTVALACSSEPSTPPAAPLAPGEGQGVATTSLTTTTLQDLDDLVHATDRPAITAGPPGPGAATDALGQVHAVGELVTRRDGPPTDRVGPYVAALADELAATAAPCDAPPGVSVSTSGSGPVVATIDIAVACDPAVDRIRYVVTLTAPSASGTGAWAITAATRQPNCTRGVQDGLCV